MTIKKALKMRVDGTLAGGRVKVMNSTEILSYFMYEFTKKGLLLSDLTNFTGGDLIFEKIDENSDVVIPSLNFDVLQIGKKYYATARLGVGDEKDVITYNTDFETGKEEDGTYKIVTNFVPQVMEAYDRLAG